MPSITIDWLHVLILLAALQGVFLAVLLATLRTNRTANRLLAIMMIAFSVYLASAVYYAAGLERTFPHFFGASYPMPLLYGPLVYLYAVCASDRSRRLTGRDALHFLPFLGTVAVTLPIYLMSGPQKLEFYQQLRQGIQPLRLSVIDGLKYVSGIAYSVATIVFLRRHHARVKQSYSSLERVNLRWLFWLAGAAAAIWLLATLLEITGLAGARLPQWAADAVAVAIAIMVYAIGYRALRQPEIFNFTASDDPGGSAAARPPAPVPTPAPPAAAPVPLPPEPAGTVQPRYERSGLSPREAETLKNALVTVMEKERPYQKSDLTLADLAARVDTTPHKLSEVFNRQLRQTFYDFVNAYRVEDVRRRMAEGQSRNLTLLALALDAGFASKSTFNHVFKKHTGKTPTEYRSSFHSQAA